MFTAYTPLDRCVGKEVRIRAGGEDYVGMLAGMYRCEGEPVLVITPMQGAGTEQHIPLGRAVVQVRHEK